MVIRVDNIHYTYPSGVKVLDGISLVIQPGEKVALVGENGSGKTTLARHLNGLLRPQSGSVWVGDWHTSLYSPARLASRVAYVFQNPDEQLFRQRVWDELAFGPQNLGYPTDQIRIMVAETLESMGLKAVAQTNPRDLGYSGRKRVALASALAMQTPVLVLDEPTAGLDAREMGQLSDLMASLHQQGKTLLVISHDMDFVAENLDRLVHLHQGQIIQDTTIEDFFGQVGAEEMSGLVAPQITRLSQRLGRTRLAISVDQFLDFEG